MKVIKRNGSVQQFDWDKIEVVLQNAFKAVNKELTSDIFNDIVDELYFGDKDGNMRESISVEELQDQIEQALFECDHFDVMKAFILYRDRHTKSRLVKDRLDYMEKYSQSSLNAATASETDANANVTMKNVANLEGEVYKTHNRDIQRRRMRDKLNELFPEYAKQYEKDLNDHIIYTHDEASTPVLKPYCMAASLYPIMCNGVGTLDGVTPSEPNDLQSFSGQVTNALFLLSAHCKGAVAFGEYFIALNYYVIKEFGKDWYNRLDEITTTSQCSKAKTIQKEIEKSMKQFIYGCNQPAGNRSYNSPFSNVSYYDKTYFNSLFEDFYYPDNTQPEWKAIDTLQRIFMQLHRKLRLIKPLTFPVTTMALVNDNSDIIDKEYKELCAEEWAKGGSFFCYNSNNPSSLASCCRVLNEIQENTFSSINGLQGIMTGSCNVITLNLNRIVQDWYWKHERFLNCAKDGKAASLECEDWKPSLKEYLISILERVYKYHIAYKTMLYDLEDKKMFASSNGGYIYIKKLYSTIGIIGYQEAAMFLNMEISNNTEYKEFLQFILSTIRDSNKKNSIRDKKRPFLFNSEAIPGENVAVKMYDWDKKDNYYVPKDRNLYASYFFNPWTEETSVLDKMFLHGECTSDYTDGGQAAHINLEEHLSKEQYLKLIDYSTKNKVSYFTFNIPISECLSCGHVVNSPIYECPKCGSTKIDHWQRIIGYLRPTSAYSDPRKIEESKRIYSKAIL